MQRARIVLGFLGGAIVVLSAFAHTIAGWNLMGARLGQTNAPADLVTGFEIGWRWGGVAMLLLGIIVILAFNARRKGQAVSLLPALLTSIAYLAFGGWALAVSGDPFFFIFIVPGAMILAGSLGGES